MTTTIAPEIWDAGATLHDAIDALSRIADAALGSGAPDGRDTYMRINALINRAQKLLITWYDEQIDAQLAAANAENAPVVTRDAVPERLTFECVLSPSPPPPPRTGTDD